LHYQADPYGEAKLIRCLRGAIYDVMVDLRPDSPSFRRWYGVELTADSRAMVYVPPGCAHGFLTLTEDCEVLYPVSEFYTPAAERGVRYDDPAFAIHWPAPVEVVSDKDRSWPDFR
jgi:dTDP-4-dehydrorhamnose 3,5-epimerase